MDNDRRDDRLLRYSPTVAWAIDAGALLRRAPPPGDHG